MSYEIIVSPYYNNLFKCYENILVLSSEPPGPLKQHLKRINIDNLSAFETNKERNCIYAIKNFENPCELLKLNEVSQLLLFFNSSIDKLVNLFPITYSYYVWMIKVSIVWVVY